MNTVGSLIVVVLLVCITTSAVFGVVGSSSWLQSSETCNGWYQKWTDDAVAWMRDSSFVIGVPPEKEVIAKAHKEGTKVLTYVTFYQVPPKEVYQRADIREHPDWNLIISDGKSGKSVFDGTENTGWLTVCSNSPGYRDYVLKHVKYLMDLGIDGLFIDNGHPESVCEGPKYKKHEHLYPDKDNIYAYRKLLEDVRSTVKSYGDDKVVIVNPGNPRQEWRDACDGQMLESYICTWAANRRWHSEKQILSFQQQWGPWADKGDAVVALSYIGHTKNSPREDAFYCYAWARLSGFIWADWFTAKNTAKSLYKIRLGKPVSPMQKGDGCYYREFEHGLVVVSGESAPADYRFNAKGHSNLLDVYSAKKLTPDAQGIYPIHLDAGQGRVYLFQ